MASFLFYGKVHITSLNSYSSGSELGKDIAGIKKRSRSSAVVIENGSWKVRTITASPSSRELDISLVPSSILMRWLFNLPNRRALNGYDSHDNRHKKKAISAIVVMLPNMLPP